MLNPKKKGKFAYAKLEADLRNKIMQGEFNVNVPIPGEYSFAEQYGISRPSVRKALSALEKDGLLSRRRGEGTFVVSPAQRSKRNEHKSLHIAIGVSWLDSGLSEYDNSFLEGAAEYAMRGGHKLSYFDSSEVNHSKILRQFKMGELDAIIWVGIPPEKQSLLDIFIDNKIPQICIHHPYKDIPYLTCNYRKGMKKTYSLLKSLGHKHIGFLNCNLKQLIYDEYEDVFKEMKQPGKFGDYYRRTSQEEIATKSVELIAWIKKLDALILGGYSFLAQTLNHLEKNNIRIPDDLSLVCFDDSFTARTYKVPISVYDTSRQEQGKQAIYCVEALLAGRLSLGERIIVRGELIIRDSCAMNSYQSESEIEELLFRLQQCTIVTICFDLDFDELRLKYVAQKPDLIIFSSMYHGGLMQSNWRIHAGLTSSELSEACRPRSSVRPEKPSLKRKQSANTRLHGV